MKPIQLTYNPREAVAARSCASQCFYPREAVAARSCASLIILLLSFLFAQSAEAKSSNDSAMLLLEKEIAMRDQYRARKEAKINSIRQEFNTASNDEARYASALELFKEYRCFQGDSAYRYAITLTDLAAKLGDKTKVGVAYVSLLDYYTSVGFFKEAAEIKSKIDTSTLPKEYLPEFYSLCDRFLQNIQSYVGGRKSTLGSLYEKQRVAYVDSLIKVCVPNSAEHRMALLTADQIFNPSPKQVIATRKMILDRFDLSDHEKAIQYSLLGHASLDLGQREEAKHYLTLSAIHDIRSNTKETTAAKMLAELLYEDGEMEDAYKLIHIAFDDAQFYNSHLRKDETSSAMRLIETEHHNAMTTRFWLIAVGAALIFLLLVSSLWFLSRMRKQKREVEKANNRLHEESRLLDKSNLKLAEVIKELKEVTQIKDRLSFRQISILWR